MWNGRWSRELNTLFEMYLDLFGVEPDSDLEENHAADFDSISYNEFKSRIIRSVTSGQRIK